VLRDVWLHKPRTILVVLAIAVGITGAGSVLNTWSLVRQVTREEFRGSNPASATLRTDFVDAALLARVRAFPAISDAQARRTVVASARLVGDGVSRTAILFARDDFAANSIGRIQPEGGAWPPADDTFVLEKSSVEFIGASIGDTLLIQIGESRPRALRVAGVARDVGLAPGWMEHDVYGFVTPATLARLGASASMTELQLRVHDANLGRDAIRRVAYDVKRVVERSGHRVTNIDVPVPGQHIHAAQIDSLLFTQGAFGVLALFLSGFLVVNLVAAMLAGQVREIGIMKAVGATTGQIAGMYLALALVLGVVACAIALPIAAIVGRAYAQFTAGLLNFSVAGITIPSRAIVAQLIVGTLLPVVAASVPVIRGCGISVSDALRDLGISARNATRGDGASSNRVLGLGRPLLLSLRNARRRRERMALTLLALATGGAVYLGALNLRTSIIGSVDVLFSAQRYDMALRFARSWSAESLEAAVTRVSGVTDVEALSGARAAVAHADGTMGNSFGIVAPVENSRLLAPALVRGRWLRAGDTTALVANTRLLADEPTLDVGRTVDLVIAGRPVRWTIVGVVNDGPSPSAYASRAIVASLVGDGRVDRVVVVAAGAKTSVSRLELIQRLRAELAQRGLDVQASQIMEQSRRVYEDHLLMVGGFLGVMSQLMIIVGGLGLAATMSLGVLERTREIGVLRAIGAHHGAILTLVYVEGLVVALASWLIALPLSVPMSVLLGRAFGRTMIPVPITYLPDATGVVRWLVIVVVVSLLACAWPALRATRIPTRVALAYE
jgi:putative ABC transport system permease protein